MASTNGFIYALQESHLPGVVVCIILLMLSAFSWTVMVSKFLMVNKARKQTRLFLDRFRRSRAPLDAYCEDDSYDGSPLFWIYQAGSREVTFQLLGSSEVDATLRARLQRGDRLSDTQMDAAAGAMDRSVGEVALRLESQMTLLATVVSGAPFLGLLGTVWGVMETFGGIASAGAGASLQSMAPGVSAALVTTVIALLVAIPAKFGYNFLVNSIRTIVVRMDNFAAELTSSFHRHYADHPHRPDVLRNAEDLPSLTEMGAGAAPPATAPRRNSADNPPERSAGKPQSVRASGEQDKTPEPEPAPAPRRTARRDDPEATESLPGFEPDPAQPPATPS